MIINRKQIWSLSWPVIIANLTIPLVGLTDTAIMGHMPTSEYIASIALGALIFTFLYAGLNFNFKKLYFRFFNLYSKS